MSDLLVFSSGFGVQSTTLGLMAIDGLLPRPDVVISADTGWEPVAVRRHMAKLNEALTSAGIPVEIVTSGNIRDDALDPDKPTHLPAFVKNPDGSQGKQSRSCTEQYKLRPIRAKIRELLGGNAAPVAECRYCQGTGHRVAPWRAKRGETEVGICSVCDGDGRLERFGLPPKGNVADMWIGYSADEPLRMTSRGPRYTRSIYPLNELGMTRPQCEAWLASRGWGDTPRSACVGCPFHRNEYWRRLRDNHPADFADAVAFDETFRDDPGLDGKLYLHRSLLPLSAAPIDDVERGEYRQGSVLDAIFEAQLDDEYQGGCSPFGCRSTSDGVA